jgi:hypothetical protein
MRAPIGGFRNEETDDGTKGLASVFHITGSKGNLRRYRLREPKSCSRLTNGQEEAIETPAQSLIHACRDYGRLQT